MIRLERKQTKGKQARVAPIYGEVRAWLEPAYLERREGELTIVSYRASDHVRRPRENTGRPRKAGWVVDQAEAWGVTQKTARRILDLKLTGDGLAEVVAAAKKTSRTGGRGWEEKAALLGQKRRLRQRIAGPKQVPLPAVPARRSSGSSLLPANRLRTSRRRGRRRARRRGCPSSWSLISGGRRTAI